MMMMLYKNIIHLSLEILLAWIKGTVKGEKGTLGKIGIDGFPASISTLVTKRTEVVSHPLLHLHTNLRNLSPLLFILFPSMDTGGGIISTADQTRLSSCFTGVKCTRLFQFSNIHV